MPGKVPLYLEGDDPETRRRERGQCRHRAAMRRRAARLRAGRGGGDAGACASASRSADVVLFDGTLFTDDEMMRTGTGQKTGRRMGHMPIDGEGGTLAGARRPYRAAHLHPHQQHQSDPDRRLARARARSRPPAGRSPRTAWRSCCETALARRTGSGAARHRRAALSPPASVPLACCTAANAPRARCRPGRSIATTIRR